jgi:hypothetical protein
VPCAATDGEEGQYARVSALQLLVIAVRLV